MEENLSKWEEEDSMGIYIELKSSHNQNYVRNFYDDISFMDGLIGWYLEKNVQNETVLWDIRDEQMRERKIDICYENWSKISNGGKFQKLATVIMKFIK